MPRLILVAAVGTVVLAPAPASPPKASDAGVRVCAGGDVSLGTNLDTSWAVRASRLWGRPVAALPDPTRLLAPLAPLFSDADVVLLNVEGAIGDGPSPPTPKCLQGQKHCYALRQPTTVARALRTLNDSAVTVGNVANNHARDAGLDGFVETQRHLSEAGVLVTGADTLATVVVTARNDTIAVLGFSASGVPDVFDLEAVRRHVARAVARYPHVVVTMHLGAEGKGALGVRDSAEGFAGEARGNPVAFAQAATDAGAELVVGHGPHVVRAVAWRGGALVAYSLGNLVTYGPFSLVPPLDRGAVLCATLGPGRRVTSAVLRPTRQRPPGRPSPDRTARAVRLVDSLGKADVGPHGAKFLLEGRAVAPKP